MFVQRVAFDQSNEFVAPEAEHAEILSHLPASLELPESWDRPLGLALRDDTLRVSFYRYVPYVPTFPPGFLRKADRPDRMRSTPAQPPISEVEPTILTGYSELGAPARSVPLTPLVLRYGEWGQLRYLGRHNYDGEQIYKKFVFNIAWLQTVSPDLFVATQPDHYYESLPNVW